MAGLHNWEVWYPKAAANGLLFARGRYGHFVSADGRDGTDKS